MVATTKPMKLTSSRVVLEKVRLHAAHGVMPQEQKVGGEFEVSLSVGCELAKAVETDDLRYTINYARLYEIVRQEMLIPSKLLEHVAGRIASNIFRSFPEAAPLDLKITKVNPPMGAHCDGASVVMSFERTPDDSLAESC